MERAVVASLIRHAATARLVAAAILLITLSNHLGFALWTCPLLEATQLPCPGCGLTRSVSALMALDWQTGLHLHAFGPVALITSLLFVLAALLPERQRRLLAEHIAWVERRLWITVILLSIFLVYWLLRLVASI
ncbi:MAG: DUF2752 domain-containing protein [Myxococcota bacterium]|nr:DUF2752 domain-containing protein [Myxococcota bacterium]